MKLPPKPRTPPIVARALMAMSLGLPVYGCAPFVPSRIGPPPCEDHGGWSGRVVGKQSKELANVEVTLTMNGATRVYKTDDAGEFYVPTTMSGDGGGPASATIPGHIVDRVELRGGECYGHKSITILADGDETNEINKINTTNNGSNSIVD